MPYIGPKTSRKPMTQFAFPDLKPKIKLEKQLLKRLVADFLKLREKTVELHQLDK